LKRLESRNADAIRLPYFDWDKVKYFYYIVKLKSMNEAAKFLNVAQPSLSRKLNILEDHLQCRLFIRTPKGLEVTRKGEELFTIVEHMFLALKGFSYNASVGTDGGRKRKIRIASTYAMAAFILNDHLLDYHKEHPEIFFELIGNDNALDVILHDVDIAIRPLETRGQSVAPESSVVREYLFSMEKRLYASEDYLKTYGEPKSVEDLKDHRLLGISHPEKHPLSDINWILRLGMPKGKVHIPIFTSNSLECIVDAAIKGHGIVASYQEMKLIKNSSLVNILPSIKDEKIDQYLLFPNYLQKDNEINKVKSYLHERLAGCKRSVDQD
jgi:DNA-binding transcriptional LysR family regulator